MPHCATRSIWFAFFHWATHRGQIVAPLVAALLVAALLPERSALAVTRTWSAGTGSWSVPENWMPMPHAVPVFGDDVEINNGGRALVTQSAIANNLYLGRTSSGNSGHLEVSSGALMQSFRALIGETGTGTATVSGSGATWRGVFANEGIYELRVGVFGNGTLDVLDGAVLSSSYSAIAWEADSIGNMTVSGDSQWNNSNWIEIGTRTRANGALKILDGGVVSTDSAYLGSETNSVGNVTLDGTNSRFTIDGSLTIGYEGTSTIDITEGAVLSSSSVWGGDVLGWQPGSSGTVNISGNSTWESWGMTIGNRGTGILNINGGTIETTHNATLGAFANSYGEVTVAGSISRWTNRALTVGRNGNAILNITSGGVVESTGAASVIAGREGSSGSVTVDGPNSKWINNKLLEVGGDHASLGGIGVLNVENGGTVATGLTLSNPDTSFKIWNGGDVNVDDASRLIVSSGEINSFPAAPGLYVGTTGFGNMEIIGGGKVETPHAFVGMSAGSIGYITVEGLGSKLTTRRPLSIGGSQSQAGGEGNLRVQDGGVVAIVDSVVDFKPNLKVWNNGRITANTGDQQFVVSGNDPILDTSMPGIYVTNDFARFSAELQIVGGGRVDTRRAILGHGANSGGGATVDGAGSIWNNSETLYVGQNGRGTIAIENGGLLTNTTAYLGFGEGSEGYVTVASGSRWTNSENITVGNWGTGGLLIREGSTVTNQSGFIGAGFGSRGEVRLHTGGTWTSTGSVFLGGAQLGPNGGEALLYIDENTTVNVGQDLVIYDTGRVVILGGALNVGGEIFWDTPAGFEWAGGRISPTRVNGDLTNPAGGALAPGSSPGTTTIAGNYTQLAGAMLEIEVAGLAPGGQHDVVAIEGAANLGGELQLALLDDFLPGPNHTFTVLSAAAGISSAFANVASGQRLATIDGSGSFLVHYGASSTYDPNQIVLSSFQTAGLAGDFNVDGRVDAADYVVWRKGTATQTDYNVWRANFGQPAGSGAGASGNAAVPEPATLVLLMFAAAGWCLRRGRTA